MLGTLLNHFDSHLFYNATKMLPMMLDIDKSPIPITVKLVKKFQKGNIAGTCAPDYNNDLELIGISITIKETPTIMGMIEALSHEMIHAKQWIDKNITIDVETKYLLGFIPYPAIIKYWNGKDVTSLPYYEQPAEIEAHLLQRQLTLSFLQLHEDKLKASHMAELYLQTDSIKY